MIKISDYIYKKCVNFAHDRIGLSADEYKYRGESSVPKMVEDVIIGTVGEWGAYKFLRDQGIKVSKPDMKIYEVKRKSFEADLMADDAIYHVKSQSVISSKRYGHSWLLQRYDKVVNNPKDNEYFIFTEVDCKNVRILGIIKCGLLKEHGLYGECKVPWYRKTKVAIYLDDINMLELFDYKE